MLDQLHQKHFNKLARLMEDHTGIRLPAAKKTMVEGRLRKRMRALGHEKLDDYAAAIFEQGQLDSEFVHLVDCVTTNKTDFFREPDHFDFLINDAVPSLRKMRRDDSKLKFWSAASSIGAEAYTIAMVAAEEFGHNSNAFVILGTDICTDVLKQAERAIYAKAMIDPIPPALRKRYIMQSIDATQQQIRIVPELRRLVVFKHLNLMDDDYPVDQDFDVIFCRNILIYFSKQVQNAVLQRLCRHLRPGGFLILGHSESLAGSDQRGLSQVAPTIFRRSL